MHVAQVCEAHDLFELPEFNPLDDWDETDVLECVAIRWEDINNPVLVSLIEERVTYRRSRYVSEGLVTGDFSVTYDFSEKYPIEVGNFVVAILEEVDFAGIVRHINAECVEIEYFDTELGITDTIEVSLNAVELILL